MNSLLDCDDLVSSELALICPDLGNCSRMLRRFVCRWHFVCQMCARPERFVREFCRAVADRATTLAFVSTLFAHCRHRTSRNSQSDDLGWLMPDQ